MATRNLQLESKYVDQFFQSNGTAPSAPDDWKSIHAAAYGSDLPAELAALPMYQSSQLPPTPGAGTPASTNPVSNTSPTGGGLSYRGMNISDSALRTAGDAAGSFNTSGFLDQVKARLQQKFKPETEVLGLGSFAATLGALDPNGVMMGINEKTGQFRRKGALMLQALTTANDIYSEQAKIASDKFTRLEDLRSAYEKEQKDAEGELQDLALAIAKAGGDIPADLLGLLPPKQVEGYKQLAAVFKAENLRIASKRSGGGDSLTNITDVTLDPYLMQDAAGLWMINSDALANFGGGVDKRDALYIKLYQEAAKRNAAPAETPGEVAEGLAVEAPFIGPIDNRKTNIRRLGEGYVDIQKNILKAGYETSNLPLIKDAATSVWNWLNEKS